MPSSFDSDQSSSPSLIPSLRSYRFKSNSKPYIPPSSRSSIAPISLRARRVVGIGPGTSDSQKSGSLQNPASVGSQRKPKAPPAIKPIKSSRSSSLTSNSSKSSTSSCSASLTSDSSQSTFSNSASSSSSSSFLLSTQNSPIKKTLSNEKFLLFIQRVTSIFQQSLKTDTSDIVAVKLKFEDIHRFRIEVSCKYPDIYSRWENNVTEDVNESESDLKSDKILNINRDYLNELLEAFSKGVLSLSKGTGNEKLSNSTRTYTRAVKNAPAPCNPVKYIIASAALTNIESCVCSDPLSLIEEGQKQLAMDDYEVFCGKETNLRHLLDAFPGADIMEAQDILVRCQWDLKKAIQVAHDKPLRCTRKIKISGEILEAKRSAHQTEGGNKKNLKPGTSRSAEEIVLDSSDEDTNEKIVSNKRAISSANSRTNTSNVPAAKRARQVLSSSSEDENILKSTNNELSSNNAKTQLNSNAKGTISKLSIPIKAKQNENATNEASKYIQVQSTVSQNADKNSKPAQSLNAVNIAKQMTKATPPQSVNTQDQKQIPSQTVGNQNVKPVATQSISIQNVKPTTTQSVSIQNVKPTQSVSIQNAKPTAPQNVKPMSTQAVTIQNSKPTPTQAVTIQNVKTPSQQTIAKREQDTTSTAKAKSPPASSAARNSKSPPASSAARNSKSPPASSAARNSKSPPASSAAKNIESIPNLPKGLVMTLVQPTTQSIGNDKTQSSNENSGIMALSKSISLTPVSSSVSITPSNLNSNINMGLPSGISITPASSSVSIKPVDKEDSSSKSKAKQQKRYDSEEEEEEYGNEDIYDSEESDCEENLTTAHSAVLSFFQDATMEELGTIPGCSKKKVDIILSIRPFKGWVDLVDKLKNDKSLSPDLLNGAKKVIDMRNAISRLMAKCQQISLDMGDLVEDLKQNKESSTDYVSKQPELLNDKMHLTSYQMLGLNWLLLMHNQEVNGILADEMGLGKTIQAVAFLAYLKQISISGPHLIVVPSSTLDNWKKELKIWWPEVSVICYHGSQDFRRELRVQILNDEIDEFDVMVTTYNMVTSSAEDRNFFKRLVFHYVVFDEAHMLKNMASQRYQNLMRIKAPRRLLLTGTPLQNNLVELMSLLIFAMPHMFSGKTEQIKQMFSCVSRSEENRSTFERDRIEHAKRIMKPFVLRRLKCDVLKELPSKIEETKLCPLSEDQSKKYHELVKTFSEEVRNNKEKDISSSGAGMMMQLRRAANHPLLLRRHFDDDKLLTMSKLMLQEPTHTQNDSNLIFEDMAVMSDFELHKLCKSFKSLKSYILEDEVILDSGKFKILDSMLPKLIQEDHRILLFSQFTMVLDIVQEYMGIKEYKYLRLDGQVPVTERQQLIDEFNGDPDIPVFLLSTRAGGLGINLTAADTVILHDIDFNPYNDKQAEDRCHRVGQIRDVKVFRFISEDTIEEGILQRAKEKLKLERDIHAENETEENDVASVAKLLRDALGLKHAKS